MFKASQLQKRTGIKTRRIQYYVDAGLVSAGHPGASPEGRDFTDDNALELLLVDELSSGCGLTLGKIKRIFKAIRDTAPDMLRVNYDLLDGYFLEIHTGGDGLRIRRSEHIVPFGAGILMDESKSCIVINMYGLFERCWTWV